MMGTQDNQSSVFSYRVNLDKRVRDDHPLRQVGQAVDFEFVPAEVATLYGTNGNESVDPAVILKISANRGPIIGTFSEPRSNCSRSRR
ncbi:MAG TPA: hypothetical protein VMV72_11325 [Verrucomicrobiae bacterium]|nr:hypothetical protein [Verrucomicrobiae bacterium]